jgi:hypothetical protein
LLNINFLSIQPQLLPMNFVHKLMVSENQMPAARPFAAG